MYSDYYSVSDVKGKEMTKTKAMKNEVVTRAVTLFESTTLVRYPDLKNWRDAIAQNTTWKIPHKTDRVIGAVLRPERWDDAYTVAVLTTHAKYYDPDSNSGVSELFVLEPWYGGMETSFTLCSFDPMYCQSDRCMKYLKEEFTCWELNQLFGHDGKFDDLPKHIEALLQ